MHFLRLLFREIDLPPPPPPSLLSPLDNDRLPLSGSKKNRQVLHRTFFKIKQYLKEHFWLNIFLSFQCCFSLYRRGHEERQSNFFRGKREEGGGEITSDLPSLPEPPEEEIRKRVEEEEAKESLL